RRGLQHAAHDRGDLRLGRCRHPRRGVTRDGGQLVLELRPAESRHYASWSERVATVARFSRPDEVHALCEEAYALGARAVLAVVDAPIREALLAFQRWRDVPVWAVVPNMFAFIRDLTDLGMVGAARADRAERLGIEAGIVTHNPLRAAAVLGRDLGRFAAVVAPCNPKGYKMFPDREACEQLYRRDAGRFIAAEVTAGGAVAPGPARAHVRALGLAGAVRE